MNPSTIALNRTAALHVGQRWAKFLETATAHEGYSGPIAVVGGYLRDIALHREPRDLDVFLFGPPEMAAAQKLAKVVAKQLSPSCEALSGIPSYGGWASDVSFVVPIAVHKDLSTFKWPFPTDEVPIPATIDLVVLDADAMREAGYTPRLVNDGFNKELWLEACLSRVDLRLNALGATANNFTANPNWDFDAFEQRLVVQFSRKDEQERINKRLQRLTTGKYQGWSVFNETQNGEIVPVSTQPEPVTIERDPEPGSADGVSTSEGSPMGHRDEQPAGEGDEAPLPRDPDRGAGA